MQPSQDELRAMGYAIHQWEYSVWQIKHANKYKLTYSEWHPDNIRKDIKRLQTLLNEALT